MAFIKSLRDAVLTVIDGTTPTPNEVEVLVASGDLSIRETREYKEILDRGTLHQLKSGDEVPMDISFSARFHGYQVADSGENAIEAIMGRGGASGYTSTLDATTNVYTTNLRWDLKDKDASTEETVTLSHFYPTSLEVSEGDDANTYTVTGRAFVTAPTIT